MFQVESQNKAYRLPFYSPSENQKIDASACSSTSSRSIGEVVLDLLRGKVAQCLEQMQRKQRRERQIFHINNNPLNNSSGTEGCSECNCKFLIIIDSANAPQYWVVQIKEQSTNNANLVESEKNYLNCIDSLELYSCLEDVCNGENRKMLLSNKNWFFLEMLIRINVAAGADILLEDFTMCNRCRW